MKQTLYQKELSKVYTKIKQEIVLNVLKNLADKRHNEEQIPQDYYLVAENPMSILVMIAEIQANTKLGKKIVKELIENAYVLGV
jgi:hypothetical protein